MIISNNNDLYNKSLKQKNNFEKKFRLLKDESKKMNLSKNPFVEDIKTIKYSDPRSNNDMRKKTLSMLQERLDKGLITIEEFNQKCNNLGKKK